MNFLLTLILPLLINTSVYKIENHPPQEDWKLAKNKNGVLVYTRNAKGTKLKEFKAKVTIRTSMKSLVDLLEDVPNYPKWQATVTSSKILKRINENEFYIFYSSDIPWPITDRDIVLIATRTKSSKGNIVYSFKTTPDYIKEKEGFIRIRKGYGAWELNPKDNGFIEVVYRFYGDPGGSLPEGIINMFIVDGPYKTLLNIKNKFHKPW